MLYKSLSLFSSLDISLNKINELACFAGTTHPLPHKVVGQIGGQHVGTERRFHHTLVDLKNKTTLMTVSVFSVFTEIQKEDFKHFLRVINGLMQCEVNKTAIKGVKSSTSV